MQALSERKAVHSFLLVAMCGLSLLTGCAVVDLAPSVPEAQPGLAIKGVVHGGQQPIVGAHVYLFAANTTGYGAASVSL